MYSTIEAFYDNGKIIPLNDELKIKRGKVLITILGDKWANILEGKSMIRNLLKYRGIIKNLPKDSVNYQREIRDEW